MKIRIVNNQYGCAVIDEDTGEIIEDVECVHIDILGGKVYATVHFTNVSMDITTNANTREE